jgi:hypothetical protein
MKRAIGIVLIVCGLGMATITIGSGLGYFTILDSGDAPSAPNSRADTLYTAVLFASEFLLIALGAWLVWSSRTRDAA